MRFGVGRLAIRRPTPPSTAKADKIKPRRHPATIEFVQLHNRAVTLPMCVRRRNLILPCLCCLLAAGLVSPTLAQYRFDHWTADTGLPQNIVTAIHQTPEGYLWVATFDGLTRFDGVRFTVFNKSITPGLSSNRFTAQGDLWAGTEVGVITRYHHGQFIKYSTEQGLPKSYVFGLTGDPQGHLWALLATFDPGEDPLTQGKNEKSPDVVRTGERLSGMTGAYEPGHRYSHDCPVLNGAGFEIGVLYLLSQERRLRLTD
jgi:hypothetical protein